MGQRKKKKPSAVWTDGWDDDVDENDAIVPGDQTTVQTEWGQGFGFKDSSAHKDILPLSIQEPIAVASGSDSNIPSADPHEPSNDCVLQPQQDAVETSNNDEGSGLSEIPTLNEQSSSSTTSGTIHITPNIENSEQAAPPPLVQQNTPEISTSPHGGANTRVSRQDETPPCTVDEPYPSPIYAERGRSYDQASHPRRRVVRLPRPNDYDPDEWDRIDSVSSNAVSGEDDDLSDNNRSLYEPRGRSLTVNNNVRRVNSRWPYQARPSQPYYGSNQWIRSRTENPFLPLPLYYPSYYPQQHANQLPAFPATPAPYRGAPTSLEPVREPPTAAPPPPDIKKENFTQFSSALIISVPVQCSFATLHSRFSTSIQQNWPEHTAESELGHICVQKVLSMNRFKRRNEEHSVQLLCCNGPSPGQKSPPEQMRWLHMRRENMDLSEFEDVALNAPGINGELKYVVLKLFKQLHNTCRKRVFGGFQIDPGTVLRCDGESSRSVPENSLSVSFLCFPYMDLKQRKHYRRHMDQDYSTRSMLQIIYPFESTYDRDRQPAFCKGREKSSKSIMYIPQLWVLVIGSKFVVTCAEADIDTIRGSTVGLIEKSNKITTMSGVPRNIRRLPARRKGEIKPSLLEILKNDPVNSTAAAMQTWGVQENGQATMPQSPSINSNRLLTGEATHNVSSDGPPRPESELLPRPPNSDPTMAANASTSIRLVNGHRYIPPTCEDYDSDLSSVLHIVPEEIVPTLTVGDPPEVSPILPQNPSTPEPRGVINAQASPTSALAEAVQLLLSRLKSLGRPKMMTEYFSSFLLIVEALLAVRGQFTVTENPEKEAVVASLEEKVERSKIFNSMCELERDNSYFSEHTEYRDSLMQAVGESHGIGHSTVSQELQKLGLAVKELEYLFDIDLHTDYNHGENSDVAEVEPLSDVDEVPPLSTSVASISDNDETNGDLNESPPFLTWTWLGATFGESVPVQRLAAENLYTIMEDIDRAMCRRKEIPYLCTEEVTLTDLERTMLNPLPNINHNNTNEIMDGQQSRVFARERPRSRQQGDPFSQPREIIYAAQKTAINNAVQKLVGVTKDFVGLFIPSGYNHSVANKVWGALHATCMNVFWDPTAAERHTRPIYLISPLGTGNVQDTGIEPLFHSFGRCTDCQHGIPYRSLDSALNHLRRFHLSNTTIVGLRRWSWRWVTTEAELRIKLYYKQQLRLLNICLTYLELLHNRAQKIHSGILDDHGAESAKYQLPNDLVDCFEATAIFIMQAAASITAIKADMHQWRYMPEISSIEHMETPSVASTLARLGELGKVAQASMTRAEKTLALSDPETDVLSVGPAGPEFLISIICQNLQNKQVLDGVDMDVNELYQSCASKLQYQINHFPRKRLLRDIHSLQEELSAVKLVNEWQQDTYAGFMHILDPKSFSTLHTSRAQMHPAESECLQVGFKSLQAKAVELDALGIRTDKLREQLKQSVEILEEDHGKAILVFTMITTIFLPLSFVTSFFGMNMEDIRSTNHSQGFFWAIALPVTAGIVVGAVLLAYHGDRLYDAIAQAFHQWRQEAAMSDHSSRVGLLSADEKPRSFYKQTKTLWKRAGRQM